MRYLRAAGVAAAVAVAALVVTAVASAHPSVYTGTSKVIKAGATPPIDASDLEDVPRYLVVNHGYPYVFRETNGVGAPGGVVSYALLPGDYRATLSSAQKGDEGGSGAQAHATCDVAALNSDAAITGWQDADPFYNYVPFQKASANLDDTPLSSDPAVADWIDDVQTLTGVNLSNVSDDPAQAATQLESLCETTLGGTFVPADAIQTQGSALASGLIEPLEAEITGLETAVAAAEQARAAAEAARAAAQAAANAASARLAEVMPQLTPLSVTLGTARATARRIARRGATATVTGPPLRTVTVRMQISQARAKKLGLRSRTLARKTVTTGADGKAEAVLKPNRRTARRLQRLRGTLTATVGAVSGDRSASTRAVITRR